ncbi:MAG: hypothetical protein AAGJ40_09170 [Planctomycetota bacterium]
MHVTISGRRYRFIYVDDLDDESDGWCDAPGVRDKAIRVRETLEGRRRLEVEIHEMTHAADWTKDEEHVDQFAKDVSAVLWRLGYRIAADEQ